MSTFYLKGLLHSFFYIGTSHFGAEDERSYLFLRYEAENVFKTFFILHYML